MSDPTGPDPDELSTLRTQLGQLAIAVDRLEREKAERRSVESLAEGQIAIRGALGQMRANPDPQAPTASPAIEWMTIEDPDAATAAITELRMWVRNVWTKYDPITDCWPWHPQVVAELLACRRVWVAATSKTAPALAPADWHQRFRIGTHKACAARLKECNRAEGHKAGDRYWDVDHQALADMAAWWASTHGTPTPGQPVGPGLKLKSGHR